MHNQQESQQSDGPLADLSEHGILAILRDPILPAGSIAKILVEAGIRHIEVSLSSHNSLQALREVQDEVGEQAVVGIGSVLHAGDLETGVAAGARFIVAPNGCREILATAQSMDIPLIPGALTPTEILEASNRGARIVKVFPVDALGGPKYIRSIRVPAPHLRLLPVGGVSLSNIDEYAAAGAVAVGISRAWSQFDDPDQLANFAASLLEKWKMSSSQARLALGLKFRGQSG